MESVLAIWHAMSLGEGRLDAQQGFRVSQPHTKLLLPFVRGSKDCKYKTVSIKIKETI